MSRTRLSDESATSIGSRDVFSVTFSEEFRDVLSATFSVECRDVLSVTFSDDLEKPESGISSWPKVVAIVDSL